MNVTAQASALWKNLHGESLDRALSSLAQQAKNRFGETSDEYATALNELGIFLRATGSYDRGEHVFKEALTCIQGGVGVGNAYATCLDNLAELYRLAGNTDACKATLDQAQDAFVDKNTMEYAACLNYRAHLAESEGGHQIALQLYEDSLEIVSANKPGGWEEATGHQNVAGSLAALGRDQEALSRIDLALKIYKVIGPNAHYIALLNTLMVLRYKANDIDGAHEAALQAIGTAPLTNIAPIDEMVTLANVASICRAAGDNRGSDEALHRAQELFRNQELANNPTAVFCMRRIENAG